MCNSPSMLAFPPEILFNIFKWLDHAKDLLNLCYTSKHMRYSARPLLYEHVRMSIPRNPHAIEIVKNLSAFGTEGLYHTKTLSVAYSNWGKSGCKTLFDDPERLLDYTTDEDTLLSYDDADERQIHKARQYPSLPLNSLMELLLYNIPRNQLVSFSWQHDHILSASTLKTLVETQKHSLRILKLGRVTSTWTKSSLSRQLTNLHTLHVGSMKLRHKDKGNHWVGLVIASNTSTLRDLKLGSERWLVESLLDGVPAFPNMDQRANSRQLIKSIDQALKVAGKSSQKLHLESLHVCGLDLRALIDKDSPKLFKPEHLRKLSLESCHGSEDFLNVLSRRSLGSSSILRLKSFHFRSEFSKRGMLRLLERFLSSFFGLEHLSVIVEGRNITTSKWLKPRCFIKCHGPTLKTLVWEGRQEPRMCWESDPVIPLRCDAEFQQLDEICEGCPNLVELGVTIDWHSELNVLERLKDLYSLKTLNIRNLPLCSSHRHCHLHQCLQCDALRWSQGASMVTEIVNSILGPPKDRLMTYLPLELITLGSLTYVDSWDMACEVSRAKGLHSYMKPSFYYITYCRNVFGDYQALPTLIGSETARGVEQYVSNLRIFDRLVVY